ncbi:hypothetical protein Mgra_00003782 [Meloidogyne graminicola]|uniref:Uncharacterized protein n=1 Tax=Meloidogyne graminicola TaxID=189291 RepID=A0A8S9ZUG8_9BILA|nr:hypothetical protein Mgra_00003782 [Meloidogyne graminicola]
MSSLGNYFLIVFMIMCINFEVSVFDLLNRLYDEWNSQNDNVRGCYRLATAIVNAGRASDLFTNLNEEQRRNAIREALNNFYDEFNEKELNQIIEILLNNNFDNNQAIEYIVAIIQQVNDPTNNSHRDQVILKNIQIIN